MPCRQTIKIKLDIHITVNVVIANGPPCSAQLYHSANRNPHECCLQPEEYTCNDYRRSERDIRPVNSTGTLLAVSTAAAIRAFIR
jgi:hypothetical protein